MKTGSEDAAVKFAWWYVDNCAGRTRTAEAWERPRVDEEVAVTAKLLIVHHTPSPHTQ
jgi:hypothetical protein